MERPALHALAERLGIEPGYLDNAGAWRATSAATAEALCAAMGWDASSEAAAARSLGALEAADRERGVDPVRVFRQHADAAPDLRVRRPPGGVALRGRLTVTDETGEVREREVVLPPAAAGDHVALSLPGPLPPGRYGVALHLAGAASPLRQSLVVAPRTALRVHEKLGDDPAWGVWANLWSLRGDGGLGFGDTGDLAALLVWCGERGGDFVGVNPLHAVAASARDVSPYSPTSRLYRNPLYLDVFAVPELAACAPARERLARADVAREIRRLREADAVDPTRVRAVAVPLWRDLYACFRERERRGPTARGERFAAWRAREGRALRDFATWEALVADRAAGGDEAPWPDWPSALRRPDSSAVARFREAHADEVAFHSWLQFELDEQLARASEAGRRAGLRIGLYQDLAVGSGDASADTWMLPGAFARGVSIGAPPDAFAPEGQDWGLPPLDPHALRADGYALFGRLLASAFRHSGALRIDHVMALQRQFWIPHGRPGSEGAYVRFPRADLLGVLALESRRAGALVIGEDLGTVPPDLTAELASWGVLSSCVYAFERDEHGFRPPERLSPRALATANTHDLAPLLGHLEGADLVARREAGAIANDAALADARRERAAERSDWLARLRAEGLLPSDRAPRPAEIATAVSRLLLRSAAPLVGLSLDDLAGETEPVNLPGVGPGQHPSWRRRMRAPLGRLLASAAVPREGRAARRREPR